MQGPCQGGKTGTVQERALVGQATMCLFSPTLGCPSIGPVFVLSAAPHDDELAPNPERDPAEAVVPMTVAIGCS